MEHRANNANHNSFAYKQHPLQCNGFIYRRLYCNSNYHCNGKRKPHSNCNAT